MDTSAYLTNQGWLGSGHALYPTGRGIKKPLLVSQKSNVLGIGKKKHDAHADQWWARAFDKSLKGLEVGNIGLSVAAENVKSRALGASDIIKAGEENSVGTSGLYAGFVRGEGLSGTITPKKPATDKSGLGITNEIENPGTVKRVSKKRKRTLEEQRSVEAKAERLSRGKEASTTTQADFQDEETVEDSSTTLEMLSNKGERRQRHNERRSGGARGAGIVQPVFRLNLADGPKLGKRTRKDKAGVFRLPPGIDRHKLF